MVIVIISLSVRWIPINDGIPRETIERTSFFPLRTMFKKKENKKQCNLYNFISNFLSRESLLSLLAARFQKFSTIYVSIRFSFSRLEFASLKERRELHACILLMHCHALVHEGNGCTRTQRVARIDARQPRGRLVKCAVESHPTATSHVFSASRCIQSEHFDLMLRDKSGGPSFFGTMRMFVSVMREQGRQHCACIAEDGLEWNWRRYACLDESCDLDY